MNCPSCTGKAQGVAWCDPPSSWGGDTAWGNHFWDADFHEKTPGVMIDLGYTLLCYLYLIYSTCSRNIRLFSQASMSFQMSVPLCLLIHLPELSSLIFLPGNLLHWCPNSLFMSLLWVNFLHAAFLPIGYPLPYVSWYIVCA